MPTSEKMRGLEVVLGRPLMAVFFLATAGLPAAGIQPRPSGRFLKDSELEEITSIACLKARQQNSHASCDQLPKSSEPESSTTRMPPAGNEVVGNRSMEEVPQFTMLSYPNYKAKVCGSDGAYFCDPYGELSFAERKNLSAELVSLRDRHLVTCSSLSAEPIDQRHLQNFYLGIVLAKELKGVSLDADSLKEFGRVIMAEWNMDAKGGAPSQANRCPNRALLMVLPAMREAVLVSDSCEFICEASGGPRVQTAVLSALDADPKNVSSAVLAGVRAAYESLPNSVQRGQAMPPPEGSQKEVESPVDNSGTYLFVQRALFAFALGAMVLSLMVATLVCIFAPGLAKGKGPRRA